MHTAEAGNDGVKYIETTWYNNERSIVRIMKKIFFKKVYTVARHIPKGKVATYGQIAHLAGNSKAARAVGMAMKNNPDLSSIPCHRVVGSDGKLVGYSAFDGISSKKAMLIKEGITLLGDRVDLSISQWQTNTSNFS